MPANIKELDRRIRSVRNTQQITKAMKMVAAAKLRRTQERLVASRPYGAKIGELLAGLSGARIDHPFFERRAVKKRLVVVVTSDKGLCGSYNANLIRFAQQAIESLDGAETVLYLVGRKASDYFRRRQWPIHKSITDMGGSIDVARIHAVADELMKLYLDDEVQEITLVYTRFLSTLSYRPERVQMLPLRGPDEDDVVEKASSKDYIYEPTPEEVLRLLLPKTVRNMIYNALAEAFTSEHGARMTSMSSATDNAGELIDKLVLFRNRARQAAITQEISEIVGGADAIS